MVGPPTTRPAILFSSRGWGGVCQSTRVVSKIRHFASGSGSGDGGDGKNDENEKTGFSNSRTKTQEPHDDIQRASKENPETIVDRRIQPNTHSRGAPSATRASSYTSRTALPRNIGQLVGTYKPTSVTQTDIRDSFGQIILQPGTRTQKKNSTHRESLRDEINQIEDNVFKSANSLPLLNASVLLDTKQYIKHTENAHAIRSGTEAARRLLRGRREWLQTVRKHAERGLGQPFLLSHQQQQERQRPSSNDQQSFFKDKRRAAYRLTGHGVPTQLLQHHIDFAGEILTEINATTLTIPSKEWMNVIREPLGTPEQVPVPENDHSLHLFLAVMERITSTLSIVLHRLPHKEMASSSNFMTRQDYESAAKQKEIQQRRAPVWHVECNRGWVVAQHETTTVEPIIEFIWPRQICIRLRGRPEVDSSMAVAMAYDATFPPLRDWSVTGDARK